MGPRHRLAAVRAALFLAGAGSALACASWDPTPSTVQIPEDPRRSEVDFDRPWTGFEGSSVGGYTLESIGSLASGHWSRERPSFSALHRGRRVYWGQCQQTSAEARTLGEVPERLICVLRSKAPGFEDASLVLTGDGTDPLEGWLWTETERFRVGTRSAEGVFALSHNTEGLEVRRPDDDVWLVIDEMTSLVRRVRVHEASASIEWLSMRFGARGPLELRPAPTPRLQLAGAEDGEGRPSRGTLGLRCTL